MDMCLGVPIPRCMRNFVPDYLPRPVPNNITASQVTRLITNFGILHQIPETEVQKCCLLAEGLDDLFVILERPASDHDYSVNFDEFISESPTLTALNDLLRFASSGSRIIQNVTIVDAYSFKPLGSGSAPTDFECFNLCQSIISIKRPKVIIGCTASIRRGHWLHQLNGTGIAGTPLITTIQLDDGRCQSLFIPSFHPSYSINHVSWCGKTRLAMIYHFIYAMRCLANDLTHPYWTSGLNHISFVSHHARNRINVIEDLLLSLRDLHGVLSRFYVLIDSDIENVRYQYVLAEIHDLTWRLCTLKFTSSGSAIAHINLCWKFLFQATSSGELFTALLMTLGTKQINLQEPGFIPSRHAPSSITTLPLMSLDRFCVLPSQALSQLEELEVYLRYIESISNTTAVQTLSVIANYHGRTKEYPISASYEFLRGALTSFRSYNSFYNDYVQKSIQIPALLQHIFSPCRNSSTSPLDNSSIILQKTMDFILSSFQGIKRSRAAIQKSTDTHFAASHSSTADQIHLFSEFDDILKLICGFDRQQQTCLRNTVKAIFAARAKLACTGNAQPAIRTSVDREDEMTLPDVLCWVGNELTLPAQSTGVDIIVNEQVRAKVVEIIEIL